MSDNYGEKKIAAYLLPTKIIIETLNRKGKGTWYSRVGATTLELDISNSSLGDCALKHLDVSQEMDMSYDQIKENWKALIKNAGFKTEKSFYEQVKRVTILKDKDKILFEPFSINISQKIFYRIPAEIKEIGTQQPIDSSLIGEKIRESWEKCSSIAK